ncbi:hypothetical protein CYY_008889 [Polysphondylium violaceum]|uniref:Ankyrin repeat-containing protein n=1 Tax=Polysphondylium violaceum TaxID=133409 RepID=A0A8J4V3H6_9MYCE|nr:hypothetical protein CYY_008889 [Polysphondylium violaceum]
MKIDFYRYIFNNVYLCKKIYQSVHTLQHRYNSLSYQDVVDIGWMIKYGHFALLAEKVKRGDLEQDLLYFDLNFDSLVPLMGKDFGLFKIIFERYKYYMKRTQLCGLFKVFLKQNLEAVKYCFERGYGNELMVVSERSFTITKETDPEIVRYLIRHGWIKDISCLTIIKIKALQPKSEFTPEMIQVFKEFTPAPINKKLVENIIHSLLHRPIPFLFESLVPLFQQNIQADIQLEKYFELSVHYSCLESILLYLKADPSSHMFETVRLIRNVYECIQLAKQEKHNELKAKLDQIPLITDEKVKKNLIEIFKQDIFLFPEILFVLVEKGANLYNFMNDCIQYGNLESLKCIVTKYSHFKRFYSNKTYQLFQGMDLDDGDKKLDQSVLDSFSLSQDIHMLDYLIDQGFYKANPIGSYVLFHNYEFYTNLAQKHHNEKDFETIFIVFGNIIEKDLLLLYCTRENNVVMFRWLMDKCGQNYFDTSDPFDSDSNLYKIFNNAISNRRREILETLELYGLEPNQIQKQIISFNFFGDRLKVLKEIQDIDFKQSISYAILDHDYVVFKYLISAKGKLSSMDSNLCSSLSKTRCLPLIMYVYNLRETIFVEKPQQSDWQQILKLAIEESNYVLIQYLIKSGIVVDFDHSTIEKIPLLALQFIQPKAVKLLPFNPKFTLRLGEIFYFIDHQVSDSITPWVNVDFLAAHRDMMCQIFEYIEKNQDKFKIKPLLPNDFFSEFSKKYQTYDAVAHKLFLILKKKYPFYKEMDQLYRNVFNNKFLSFCILKKIGDLQSDRNSLHYCDIVDVGWMVNNNHLGVLSEKLQRSEMLGFGMTANDLQCIYRIRDKRLFGNVFERFKYQLLDTNVMEPLISSGNVHALEYVFDKGYNRDFYIHGKSYFNHLTTPEMMQCLIGNGWIQVKAMTMVDILKYNKEFTFSQEIIDVFVHHTPVPIEHDDAKEITKYLLQKNPNYMVFKALYQLFRNPVMVEFPIGDYYFYDTVMEPRFYILLLELGVMDQPLQSNLKDPSFASRVKLLAFMKVSQDPSEMNREVWKRIQQLIPHPLPTIDKCTRKYLDHHLDKIFVCANTTTVLLDMGLPLDWTWFSNCLKWGSNKLFFRIWDRMAAQIAVNGNSIVFGKKKKQVSSIILGQCLQDTNTEVVEFLGRLGFKIDFSKFIGDGYLFKINFTHTRCLEMLKVFFTNTTPELYHQLLSHCIKNGSGRDIVETFKFIFQRAQQENNGAGVYGIQNLIESSVVVRDKGVYEFLQSQGYTISPESLTSVCQKHLFPNVDLALDLVHKLAMTRDKEKLLLMDLLISFIKANHFIGVKKVLSAIQPESLTPLLCKILGNSTNTPIIDYMYRYFQQQQTDTFKPVFYEALLLNNFTMVEYCVRNGIYANGDIKLLDIGRQNLSSAILKLIAPLLDHPITSSCLLHHHTTLSDLVYLIDTFTYDTFHPYLSLVMDQYRSLSCQYLPIRNSNYILPILIYMNKNKDKFKEPLLSIEDVYDKALSTDKSNDIESISNYLKEIGCY